MRSEGFYVNGKFNRMILEMILIETGSGGWIIVRWRGQGPTAGVLGYYKKQISTAAVYKKPNKLNVRTDLRAA